MPDALTDKEQAALDAIMSADPRPSERELAAALNVDKKTAVGRLRALEQKGWISRQPATRGKRREIVVLDNRPSNPTGDPVAAYVGTCPRWLAHGITGRLLEHEGHQFVELTRTVSVRVCLDASRLEPAAHRCASVLLDLDVRNP